MFYCSAHQEEIKELDEKAEMSPPQAAERKEKCLSLSSNTPALSLNQRVTPIFTPIFRSACLSLSKYVTVSK